jgi:hypothetical protein
MVAQQGVLILLVRLLHFPYFGKHATADHLDLFGGHPFDRHQVFVKKFLGDDHMVIANPGRPACPRRPVLRVWAST